MNIKEYLQYLILLLVLLLSVNATGQIAFEENFEDDTIGVDLTAEGQRKLHGKAWKRLALHFSFRGIPSFLSEVTQSMVILS